MKGFILFFLNFLLISTPHAELNPQAIAWLCVNCHGQDNVVPNLKILSTETLQEKLFAYKNDKLAGTIMPRIAKGYSDAELISVANFLAKP